MKRTDNLKLVPLAVLASILLVYLAILRVSVAVVLFFSSSVASYYITKLIVDFSSKEFDKEGKNYLKTVILLVVFLLLSVLVLATWWLVREDGIGLWG